MKVHVHVLVPQIYAAYLEVRRTDAVAQTADALCRTAKLELKDGLFCTTVHVLGTSCAILILGLTDAQIYMYM